MKHPIFKEKRWVVWNAEKAGGRTTKIPYSITGKKASSTDESTWTTYEKAKAASEFFSGIGVVFTPDQTLLGIDIDHVVEDGKVIGEHAKAITKLIKEADSYTEISPSGTGLHIYLHLTGPLALEANRHSPFEAYTSGRYFTFSEVSFHGKPKEIRTISPKEALKLLTIIGYPWEKPEAITKKGENSNEVVVSTSLFTDEELLKRMFDSRNGADIKKLYQGDATAKEGDLSRTDAALLSHLAFWSRKDKEQMERIWLASPLGSREKTQQREDYRLRSITAALKSCDEVYQTQEERIKEETGIDFLYTLGAQGQKLVTKNTENICRILREDEDFEGRFRYDTFTNVYEIQIPETKEWRALEDNDAVAIQTQISIKYDFFRTVGKEMVFDAIMLVGKEEQIDSALDFIRSVEWDGEERLDQWLTHTFGTPDDEYHRAVASNWIKGLVKRIIKPGCKFDYVLVLEGEQGAKKSTSLHVLGMMANGQSLHVETTMSTDSKDFFMQFQGKAIIEFSEGETLSRTEVKKMKAIITMQSDKYRPPYGRVSLDFPRRCVFAMTTNQEQYLKDETGNRRWLPVRVIKEEADVEWLRANRDQLLAEAYHRLVIGNETIYEFPKEETRRQQEARRISDPNEDRIVEWYYNDPFNTKKQDEGITIQQVYEQALSQFGAMKKYEEMAIADVLRNKLKLKKLRKYIDGAQRTRWFPENTPLSLDDFAKATAGDIDDEDLPPGFNQ